MLRFFRRRKALTLMLGLVAVYAAVRLLLLYETKQSDLSIGSKNFTESIILGELYAQALEREGLSVRRKFNLGGTLIAHEALKNRQIDLYPEYTGTGLIDVLRVSPPKDEEKAFLRLSGVYQKRWGLRWLKPAEANNSQGLVMTRSLAEKHDIATLSDLAGKSSQFSLGSIPEFEEREDGLRGLKDYYGGFRFKRTALYDNGLKYQVLERGDVDVTVAFTTDGALTDPELRLLEDDRQFWPAYRIAPVMTEEALNEHPEVVEILNRISATLDTETLQALNHKVDQQKQDYRIVVENYLTETL